MRKVVRTPMCNCQDIQSFLTFPTTDVTEASLLLLCVGSSAEATPMASILNVLTVPVDSDGALGTLEDGVTEFSIIAKTGSTWRPQHGLFTLVMFGFLLLHILLQGW